MKSKIVRHEEKKEIEYPCLMESNETGNVVMFYAPESGVLLHVGDGLNNKFYYVGKNADDWTTAQFTPFHGEIILSNGE